MSATETMQFEKKLAFHMAPSLLGIKCANLISIRKADFNITEHLDYFNNKASAKKLEMKILCTYTDKVLIILYSRKLLKRQLDEHRAILSDYGYPAELTIENALDRLAERIQDSGQFPHEIGIFLGYPVEDVLGFIENKGENYLLSGYWKVYGDAEQARRTFSNYDKCRKFLCNKLNQGCNIYQALKIY
ncbi:MAG: DUF3793 family protein [Ruminococcus flavefaciens]|nr:DUF3793 family protein [Ruminococcus flavefaciens]MCM1230306.1 DUF3793 family protein [Ruminococcus flavefaciens]